MCGGVTLQVIVKYPSENFHSSDNFDVPVANLNRVLKKILLFDDENWIRLSRTRIWIIRRAAAANWNRVLKQILLLFDDER
jgi:hypothetical protein